MFEYFDIDLTKASFEWDEEKDRINFMKHGIHFRTAARVFLDPNKLIREDAYPFLMRGNVLAAGLVIMLLVEIIRRRHYRLPSDSKKHNSAEG